MNVSALFIRRPIATSLLTAALFISGALAYGLLTVAPLPEVDYPTISVSAQLPGASPDTMASAVATPLERMFGRISGVTEMTSTSQLGSTNVVLQFDLSRNADAAARDVQAAINAARGQLPSDLPTNPAWRKVNPAESPIMILALTSNAATPPQMYDVADSILAQKLSQVDGIGQVFVGGSAQPAVRVEVNPLSVSKLGIGLEDVRTALENANANSPKGELSGSGRSEFVDDNDQLFRAQQYSSLIISYNNNGPVRLSDVATVVDGSADIRNSGLTNGMPTVLIILYRQPQASIVTTVDRVRALLPQLQASIPPSINILVAQDRTTTIRASVLDVEITLLISVLLVVLVVFAFLRNLWATVIPSISVPLSLVGTFGVMYLLGYTIDNLSLLALTISTGFVVDDAIVVIENISRYLENGYTPEEAALRGSREIGFTVLAMSISLIAVFVPILLMGGIVGRIFREFAITLSVAVLISMVVSLTTTPAMCAKFLKSERDQTRNRWYRASELGFGWLQRGYANSLRWVLDHRRTVLMVTLGTACLAVYLYVIVPKGMFPLQDTGRMTANVLASEDISFQSMSEKMAQYVSIIQNDPAIDVVTSYTGGGRAVNTARMFITLKPLSVRKVSVFEIINRLRGKLAVVPGATCYLQATQDMQIGGRIGNALFQYTLQGDNTTDLLVYAPRVLDKLRTLPELRDISTDLEDRGLESELIIDRDTASRLGVTASEIDNVLYDAFGQRQVSTMYEGVNQYHVVMEVAPEFQQDPDALGNIYVRPSTGEAIPLSTFMHYQARTTSLAVAHQGQFPAVTISFNLASGVPLSDAVKAIQNIERTIALPSSIHPGFEGTAQVFQSSLSSEPYLILAALVSVYIVLGVLYENYVHPLTILSTLPSAGVGAILALLVFRTELSVIALIGIILLIGIVKKNAILMIDFAIASERNEGTSPDESIYQACLLRFRPIMMTTMAAMFGGLPIALGAGNGAELRRPLGITIVGGLIFSQMLTLYTTPVMYLYLDKFRAWVSGGKSLRPLSSGSVTAPPAPSATD